MSSPDTVLDVARGISQHLAKGSHLSEPPTSSSERVFQQWLYDELRKWVEHNHPGSLRVLGEASGGGISPVRGLGAGSWPDIAVVSLGDGPGNQLLAVEVKCLRRQGLPNTVAHALGQALMYRADYPRCLVVFVLLDDVDVSYLDRLSEKLPDTGIEIAVLGAFLRSQAHAR